MTENEFEVNIVRLESAQYQCMKEAATAKRAGDQQAYDEALLRLAKYNKEAMAALKAEGRQFEKELALNPADDDNTKVAQLLGAFVRGTRLARIWRDIIAQSKVSSCCSKKVTVNILPALDAMGRLGDLIKFLDHPDLAVRAKAASWLLDTMPERCVPILEQISDTERMLSAGWIAHFALSAYGDDVRAVKDITKS